MSDIPVPKFRIGQIVWYAEPPRETTAILPCPDCLGTKTWTVSMPNGVVLETACQRCSDRHGQDIRRPAIVDWTSSVRPLTIGSIQINTHCNRDWDEEPVKYMCEETGVGTGSVYHERLLHADAASAQAAADLAAAEKRAERDRRPETAHQRTIAALHFLDARAYERLREKIEGLIEDDAADPESSSV